MGIYRCNHCKHIAEHVIHRSLPPASCEKCGQTVHVYDTPYFVRQVVDRYVAAMRELNILKSQLDEAETGRAAEKVQQDAQETVISMEQLSQSNELANPHQHSLLAAWFKSRQIEPQFDYAAVDMSGYYDEAAEAIGVRYPLLKDMLGRIGWAYRNNHSGVNLNLKKYSQQESQHLNNICRRFYSHTLFSRYYYQKQDKIISLKLQSATPVQQFFSGTWLEWYALCQILSAAVERGCKKFSCARSAKIRFANGDLFELDVVFLCESRPPLVIECKTGEFRRDLDKYFSLRKRLNIPAENFIILATDLDNAQAKAFSSMYGLTFTTLDSFKQQIAAYW